MAETGKRVEVHYGAFSCTIEGYDDPAEEMRGVLAIVQRLIAEAPALADAEFGLDDDQFARLDQALADRRAAHGDQGMIVIRSGDRAAGDAEDAEILADAAQRDGEEEAALRPDQEPADASGPHPSPAIHPAPAAAVAEATFASMATDETDATDAREHAGDEAPLGEEQPQEPATSAALFAAPAAEIAESAFSGDFGGVAKPAQADDDAGGEAGGDAGDADLVSADEAAAEQAQTEPDMAAPRLAGETGSGGEAESFFDAEPPLREEDAGPRDATGGREDESEADGEPTGWTAPWGQAPEPSTDAERGAEPLPRVNIFAPPPADAPEPRREPDPEPDEERTRVIAAPSPEPLASLRRKPGPAAVEATAAARWESGEAEEPDEVLDDGAGDWLPGGADRDRSEAAADGPEAASDTTENRLAALITRYQSGAHEREAEAAEHAATGGISAAELADRFGAADVADLLAASAAWLALAGGRPQFSRREVMEVFETLPGDHPRTLEARIKGFGKLVRSGTLVLVEDGAFAMPARERERFHELMDQR